MPSPRSIRRRSVTNHTDGGVTQLAKPALHRNPYQLQQAETAPGVAQAIRNGDNECALGRVRL